MVVLLLVEQIPIELERGICGVYGGERGGCAEQPGDPLIHGSFQIVNGPRHPKAST
jgi:hypothetical protein